MAALDCLVARRDGEPKIVHDNGSQCVARVWRAFVGSVGSGANVLRAAV
jgi:hypothetical protein